MSDSVSTTITLNGYGQVRREKGEDGKSYLVAPSTLIVPGVLPGSKGPLLYNIDDIRSSAPDWDGMPIVLDHPYDPTTNEPLSAKDDGVLDRQQLGVVRNPTAKDKLKAEMWFDEARTKKLAPKLHKDLLNNKPVELSTGLFTDNEPADGFDVKGRRYSAIARNYRPDHLAVLLDRKGACNLNDGCGVLVNASKPPIKPKPKPCLPDT